MILREVKAGCFYDLFIIIRLVPRTHFPHTRLHFMYSKRIWFEYNFQNTNGADDARINANMFQ